MSLLIEKKKILDLEKDLLLTKDDFGAIGTSRPHEAEDLASYLDFLDELWESGGKGSERSCYSEQFQL
jgi:hypothetical protein